MLSRCDGEATGYTPAAPPALPITQPWRLPVHSVLISTAYWGVIIAAWVAYFVAAFIKNPLWESRMLSQRSVVRPRRFVRISAGLAISGALYLAALTIRQPSPGESFADIITGSRGPVVSFLPYFIALTAVSTCAGIIRFRAGCLRNEEDRPFGGAPYMGIANDLHCVRKRIQAARARSRGDKDTAGSEEPQHPGEPGEGDRSPGTS
jgi:hypothetical protein